MTRRTATEVRAAIMAYIEPALRTLGLSAGDVHDEFDLRGEGVIDSLGFVQLLTELEAQLGITPEVDGMDPDNLTIVGPLCRYIAERSTVDAAGS